MDPGPNPGSVCLFSVANQTFTVDDVIAAAVWRGEIEPLVDEVHRLLAQDERDEESTDPLLQTRVVRASEAFRYAHDLITAEETEGWLRARGMTVQDFGRWFHLREADASNPKRVAETKVPGTPADLVEDSDPLLRIHLWMTDEMEPLAEELRRRICATKVLDEESGAGVSPSSADLFARHESPWSALKDPAWNEEMERAETAYRTLRSRVVTDDSRNKLLRSSPLAFTRVEIASLDVDSEGAAREFFLATQTEERSLSELSAEMGFRIERRQLWLDRADEWLGQGLISASEGQTLPPVPAGNGFRVVQVVRKIAPDLSDPEIRTLVDRQLTDGYFSELTARLSRSEIHSLSVASR